MDMDSLLMKLIVGERKIHEIKNNLDFLSSLSNFKSRHLLKK